MSDDLLSLLNDAADRAAAALGDNADWSLVARDHAAQYGHDLVADAAVLEVLDGSGVRILSEESGWSGEEDAAVTVIVDPVDGSTNASLGIPHWCVSLLAVDADGPVAAVVLNPVNGERYTALAGGGARLGGGEIHASERTELRSAVIGLTGTPTGSPGWAQFRAMGSAAMDMCFVAAGRLDGFWARYGLALWDYGGAALVCQEAGATVGLRSGSPLYELGDGRRQVLVGCTQQLHDQLSRAVA
ncbi:MAG: inositol monophosphatase [Actinomycetota bacterium]